MAAKEPRETENTEIAKTAQNGAELETPRLAVQFRDYLRRAAEENKEARVFDVAATQLEKILEAETFDEIMDADMQGTHETRDLVGMEIEIHDQEPQIVESAERFEATLDVYMQFTATALMDFPQRNILAGQDLLISSGAALVIGKIRTLKARGFLPAKVKIMGTETPNGVVLKLGKIPNRPIAVSPQS